MEITLIAILTAAFFAVIGLLGTALFQLRNDIDKLRVELKAEIADLRGRLDTHLGAHDQPA